MSAKAVMRTEFPKGHTVFFGVDGKVIMTPRSFEHSNTIRSMQIATLTLGSHPRVTSDVYLNFPADEYSAPDLAIIREDAQKQNKRYSFEDVLLITEVVSVSSARKDYDDCTAKYGRYGIPVYLVVDPYAREVLVHTSPTGDGYITTHTHKYGTGKLPIPLADGRTFTLDLDELPVPEA
ncbi:Uma2 family endonuclease [Streptomyces acidiscabies]|uniref:Uma2 family endonuclease n=1 Tax=Streptomyces acidiscabies TaxID=42234 RepID=A0AAP6BLY9_9ACTN|nr:Uma2 family endonuclease [Streptomyces acidiscabies]MBP5938284.1 Uma2 family endonuclease [Streptomyces sp. LBUM 1476]MBZ3909308.1 Uma2 family endonuclease [Streptomyces acidiscabies]MDX2966998.1 Uma2 family endonuclease [Streptomyces acidiscabies]MDX3016284.1 Uma2 family endonuclease [Streptomyces acidiscabies]MDX3796881.1 Uma2 family endonuclease [Streptomyces acidiscabies]